MIHAKHTHQGARSPALIPIVCLSLVLVLALGAAIYFGIQSSKLSDELAALEQRLADAQQQVGVLQGQVSDLQGQLESKADNTGDGSGDDSGGDDVPAWNPQSTVDPDGPAYQKLYPDFYADQPYNATTARDNVIHLTFDDGPSDRTDEILDVLKKENVKATFFVLHNNNKATPDRLRRIVAEGHTLAFHSYSHKYDTIYASVEAYLEDAYKIYTEIKEATGVAPQLFRCPGGSRNSHNKATADAILAEMKRRGFVCHDWNLSVEDSVTPYKTAEEMVDFVMGYVGKKTRGVVLLHDAKGRVETAKAVPELIRRFRERGFTFDKLTPTDQPFLFGKK